MSDRLEEDGVSDCGFTQVLQLDLEDDAFLCISHFHLQTGRWVFSSQTVIIIHLQGLDDNQFSGVNLWPEPENQPQ